LSIIKNIYEDLGIEGGSKSLKSLYRKKIKENFGNDEKLSIITATYEAIKDSERCINTMIDDLLMLKSIDIKKEKSNATHFLKEQFENPFEVGK